MEWIIEVYNYKGHVVTRKTTIDSQLANDIADIKDYFYDSDNNRVTVDKIILIRL